MGSLRECLFRSYNDYVFLICQMETCVISYSIAQVALKMDVFMEVCVQEFTVVFHNIIDIRCKAFMI